MKQLHTLAAFLFFIICCCQLHAQYTIPVVVHVIHDNGPENIPDSIIRSAIAEVNQNFNAQNPSLVNVVPSFTGIIGNMHVDFCLAHTDPQGLPTSGIEHIANPLTYYGDSLAARINQWPQDKYMNIWVVDSLRSTGWTTFMPGLATSPADADLHPATDGVVAAYFTFTSGQRGFLTNLLAHYLNLENTWGKTSDPGVACGDDDVYDTPVTMGDFLTCNTSRATCNPPAVENVQNFMNYSTCPCMFTRGQVDRVHHALDSTLAHRNNLWKPANLSVTCAEVTGIDLLSSPDITVGPNPCENDISIRGVQQARIRLYDIIGQQLMDEHYIAPIQLHLSELAEGVYTLLINEGAMTRSFKITRIH